MREDAPGDIKRRGLLVCIGHTGRERGKMPVHMAIALLAAKRQDVEAFGRHYRAQRLGDQVEHPLERQILCQRDISPRLKLGASRSRTPRPDAPGREPKLTSSIPAGRGDCTWEVHGPFIPRLKPGAFWPISVSAMEDLRIASLVQNRHLSKASVMQLGGSCGPSSPAKRPTLASEPCW